MNKRSYYYIKLNTAYLSDTKFLKQSDTTKFHYIALYLLACEGDAGGVLVQNEEILSVEDMAFLLHEKEDAIQESLNKLVKAGLVTFEDSGAYTITRFMEEQGKVSFGAEEDKKKAQWRERQAKHRKNSKQDLDIDKDLDIDIDIDIEGHNDVTRDNSVTSNASSPSFKTKTIPTINDVRAYLAKKLDYGFTEKKWDMFIKFYIDRYKTKGEKLGVFTKYCQDNSITGKELIYMTSEKLINLYPNAYKGE